MQLKEAVDFEFKKIEAESTRVVDWDSPVRILGPKEFVDRWRILLWEKAFLPFLSLAKGSKFVKETDLRAFDGGEQAIKGVLYKCFIFLIAILYFTFLIAILYFTILISIYLYFLPHCCFPFPSLSTESLFTRM